MKRRPPRSTRIDTLFPLHDALPIYPGIAYLLDGGSLADGRPYFVMEYVQGESITTHANRKRLDVPARLELFRDVCARSEEHTSELQSLMRISYAVFCLKTTNIPTTSSKHT